MKQLNKQLLALLLVVVMSISFCVPAMADNESNDRGAVFSAELDKLMVYVSDQEQTVVVSIKSNQKVTLDSFEANVAEEGGIKGTAVSSQDLPGFNIGSGKVAWMSFTEYNYETDHICDITFTVPANTPAGTYTIGLKTLQISADVFQGKGYWEETAVATATLTVACPHSVKTEHPAVDATCTEPGAAAYYTCDACGQLLDQTGAEIDAVPVTDALGHDAQNHDRVEPTHETDGSIEYWTCARCGKLFADAACTKEITAADTVLAATGHAYSAVWSSDSENHWHTCSCGSKADQAAHEFRWVIDKTATEENAGLKHEECGVCGYAKAGVEIPQLDHTHDMVHHDAAAATCTVEGAVEYWHCTKCSKNFADAAGLQELASTTAPALGHDMTHRDAQTATCSEPGHIEYWSCGRCGKLFADAAGTKETQDVTLPPDPAHHGEMEVRGQKEATCTAAGYTGDKWCLACGQKISDGESIDALGHDMTHHDAQAATCSEPGHIEYWSCGRCGELFADAEGEDTAADVVLPATGHRWDDGVVSKEPAAAVDGEKTFTCTVCGEARTEVIPATGETTSPENPTTPKTGDAGVTGYAAAAALAAFGGAVVLSKKKRTV